MKCIKTFVILCSYILLSCNVYADSPEIIINNRRYTTPRIVEGDSFARPDKFGKTNNLRRKSGSPFLAKGEYLFIDGYLTDILNAPIEGARIKIWQANHFGYYNHILRHTEDSLKYDVDFEGTGTAVTNNLGYFQFITIVPGYYGSRAPHVHFVVQHDLLENEFETQMFFPGHPRNLLDSVYTAIGTSQRAMITPKVSLLNPKNPNDGKYALFNIRLDWIHPNKSY